jgi:hypothetical protein
MSDQERYTSSADRGEAIAVHAINDTYIPVSFFGLNLDCSSGKIFSFIMYKKQFQSKKSLLGGYEWQKN